MKSNCSLLTSLWLYITCLPTAGSAQVQALISRLKVQSTHSAQ